MQFVRGTRRVHEQKGKMKMKKLVVMLMMVMAAVVANAASVKWNAANLYGKDGVTKFTGDVTLHCVEDANFTSVVKANNGLVAATTVQVADALAGTVANFYITFEDGGTFTSANKSVAIVNSASTASVLNFGNMASQTQNPSNWKSGGDAPEPTSGLLLLIGGAMLALRRKQK